MKTLPLASILLISLLPASKAAVTTIRDFTFNPADWSFQIIHEVGAVSYESAQVATGGNPGEFQTIKCNITGAGQVQVLATYTVDGFDPSILGPIDSIDYSYDRRNFPEAAYRDVNDRLAIIQDGAVYFRSMGNIATDTTDWEHKSVADLRAPDFDEWGAATGSPDFSSSGGPIQFGYIRGSATNNQDSNTRRTMSGTDNWTLTIHYAAVPEPTILGLIAASLALLPFVRRR